MNTAFMYARNSKTSDSHRLILDLTDKKNLKRSDKYVALSYLSICYAWKNTKTLCKKKINLKRQLQHEIKNFNYLMDRFLSQIFKIILIIS